MSKKERNLESLIKSFKKEFGDTIDIAENVGISEDSLLSTSILTLDLAIGGGIPKKRVVEIYGQESSGKTSLSLVLIREAQKKGFLCSFIDAESSFDPFWAKAIGVDTSSLLVVSPDSFEDALKKLEFLLKQGSDFIVFDSIPALPTVTESQNEIGDANIAIKARILSSTLARINPLIRDNEAIVVFINQIREKVGVYGNPETTPGGRALKFFSSLRLNLRKRTIKDSDEYVGEEVVVKVEKNKLAPPGKEARYILYYDGRIVIDYASILLKLELAEKSGAWYMVSIPGVLNERFHGKDQLNDRIYGDKKLKEKVEQFILEQLKHKKEVVLDGEDNLDGSEV
jgi:recombination protein RecA